MPDALQSKSEHHGLPQKKRAKKDAAMIRRKRHGGLTRDQILDLINHRPILAVCKACIPSEKTNHFTTIWLYKDNATWLVWYCDKCKTKNYQLPIGAFVPN